MAKHNTRVDMNISVDSHMENYMQRQEQAYINSLDYKQLFLSYRIARTIAGIKEAIAKFFRYRFSS